MTLTELAERLEREAEARGYARGVEDAAQLMERSTEKSFKEKIREERWVDVYDEGQHLGRMKEGAVWRMFSPAVAASAIRALAKSTGGRGE